MTPGWLAGVHPTVPMGPLTADQVENIKAQVVRIQRSIEKLEKQKRILDSLLCRMLQMVTSCSP